MRKGTQDLGSAKSLLHRRFLPAIKESSGLDPLDHEVQYFYAALEAQEVTETHNSRRRYKRIDCVPSGSMALLPGLA